MPVQNNFYINKYGDSKVENAVYLLLNKLCECYIFQNTGNQK